MDGQEQLDQLLRESRAVLVRNKNNRNKNNNVYRLPNGETFVTSRAKSTEAHYYQNAIHELRNLLGIKLERRKSKNKKQVKTNHLAKPFLASLEPAPPTRTLKGEIIKLVPVKTITAFEHKVYVTDLPVSQTAAPWPDPLPDFIPSPLPDQHAPQLPRYRKPIERIAPSVVYTPTREVLAEANRILKEQGDKAATDYLNHHRNEFSLYYNKLSQESAMSKLDEMVATARKAIINLDAAIATEIAKKTQAEERVTASANAITGYTAQRKELVGFVETYDLAASQIETIEKIVPHSASKPEALTKSSRANGVTIRGVALELIDKLPTVKAIDVFDACVSRGLKVAKTSIHTILNAEAAKPNSPMKKMDGAVYAKNEDFKREMINGSSKHHGMSASA